MPKTLKFGKSAKLFPQLRITPADTPSGARNDALPTAERERTLFHVQIRLEKLE
jgi:hypothetical protein